MARDSVGSLLGTSRTQDYVLLAVLAVVGYVVYQAVQGVKTVAGAAGTAAAAVSAGFTATGNALGSGLYALFGPSDAQALGSMTYLMVNFPDGARHAVPGNTVGPTGLFQWTGYPPGSAALLTLQLMKDTAAGAWYATAPATNDNNQPLIDITPFYG
jgi:hypothetical protein